MIANNIMQKKEAQFTTIFQSFIRACASKHKLQSGPMEMKIDDKKDGYINFSDVTDDQINCLMACTTDKGYIWKIPDFGGKNPFDCFFYRNSPAYIIFAYPKTKKKKTNNWYMFTLTTYLHEKKTSTRKSLTEQRASEICILSDSYKMQ